MSERNAHWRNVIVLLTLWGRALPAAACPVPRDTLSAVLLPSRGLFYGHAFARLMRFVRRL